jgi:uncharacterized membrane protein
MECFFTEPVLVSTVAGQYAFQKLNCNNIVSDISSSSALGLHGLSYIVWLGLGLIIFIMAIFLGIWFYSYEH